MSGIVIDEEGGVWESAWMELESGPCVEFCQFPKMARLSREVIVTEKIDGTNACVLITEGGQMFTGSRTRWITPEQDNYGFARWAVEHRDELMTLGPGRHYGEWWGNGIQRGYGLGKGDKRFSLFNVVRWCLHGTTPAILTSPDPGVVKLQDVLPACVGLVPILDRSIGFQGVDLILEQLKRFGSAAVPGYDKPEGIVCFHVAGNVGFKKTIEKDEQPKGWGQ